MPTGGHCSRGTRWYLTRFNLHYHVDVDFTLSSVVNKSHKHHDQNISVTSRIEPWVGRKNTANSAMRPSHPDHNCFIIHELQNGTKWLERSQTQILISIWFNFLHFLTNLNPRSKNRNFLKDFLKTKRKIKVKKINSWFCPSMAFEWIFIY